MTTPTDILLDALDRVHGLVPAVVEGLEPDELLWRPDGEANHIAWLVWHLTRLEDDHVAGVAGVLGGSSEQLYPQGWAERFGLPYSDETLGYGMSSEEVGVFELRDPALLTGYHEAVHQRTVEVLGGLSEGDYETVVDESFDPPVTVAVRLVSLVNDMAQHVGQAAYVRGLVERRQEL